jgi:hypothetical protein
MDRTDNWCIGVRAGSLWAYFARLVRGGEIPLKSMTGGLRTLFTTLLGTLCMSGVVDVKEYQLVQKLESKKGLHCVVLETSVVIITFGIGITKVEAAGKH